MNLTLSYVNKALSLADFDVEAAHQRLFPSFRVNERPPDRPGSPRSGAVLLLLYRQQEEWHILLTRRTDKLQSHAGQISFPGGRREGQESLLDTALRETHEEVGIDPAGVQPLGSLQTIYIPPTDFIVHPFVGWHERPLQLRPDPYEVAEILEVPLSLLLNPSTYQREIWELRGMLVDVPFFRIGAHKVWGATAIILSEFLERLRATAGAECHSHNPATR